MENLQVQADVERLKKKILYFEGAYILEKSLVKIRAISQENFFNLEKLYSLVKPHTKRYLLCVNVFYFQLHYKYHSLLRVSLVLGSDHQYSTYC